MATVHEIIEFVQREGLGDAARPPLPEIASARISRARPDREARDGEMAWISPKASDADARARSYAGTLLLAPAAVAALAPERTAAIACPNPKLAFVRVANEFLADRARIDWPAGPASISADAVIGERVALGAGVVIGPDVELGDGVTVGPNTCIANATVAAGSRIGCNCTIGQPGFGYERDDSGAYQRFPHTGRVVIHEAVEIGNNTCIDRGALGDTVIGPGCKIDNLVHIAHNVTLGRDVVVIAHAMVAGSVRVEDGAWIAPSASILNQLSVGAGALIGLGAVVVRPVAPGVTVVGNPARPIAARE